MKKEKKKEAENTIKYYSLAEIDKKKADYNIIIGERSNGKTYAVLERGLKLYAQTGKQMAIIRRWDEDFKGKRGQSFFQAHVNNGLVSQYTHGEWTDVYYYSSRWYLCRYDKDNKRIIDTTPFAYGFSLTAGEHDKSTAYPDVTTILFDEFISRNYYPDEFVIFQNVLSTIIRLRDDVKIYMCGNTINKYDNPYIKEMGLKHMSKMEQGTIDVYQYGKSELKVAVEYCSPMGEKKKSNKYFAFDNPALRTIQNGQWEIPSYPHLDIKFKNESIVFKFYIELEEETIQCDIVTFDGNNFIYAHYKTNDIKNSDIEIIYTLKGSSRWNIRQGFNGVDNIDKKILWYFKNSKVFYQDNEVGEMVNSYIRTTSSR